MLPPNFPSPLPLEKINIRIPLPLPLPSGRTRIKIRIPLPPSPILEAPKKFLVLGAEGAGENFDIWLRMARQVAK